MSEYHGAIWWSELMTRDADTAIAYYRDTCGWSIEKMDMPEGAYWICAAGGRPVAGIMDMGDSADFEGLPPHWFTYIAVDDVDAALASTKAAGGTVRRDAFDVPGVGRIGIIADPTGAAVGLMTPVIPEGAPA